MENQTGVYQIVSKISGNRYIGSARVSFKSRFDSHKSCLRRNKHKSSHLQMAWNKYGENNFLFLIIDVLPKDQCLAQEQMYFDTVDRSKLYNTSYRATGGNGHANKGKKRKPSDRVYSPLSDDQKKKISESVRLEQAINGISQHRLDAMLANCKAWSEKCIGSKRSQSNINKQISTRNRNKINDKGYSFDKSRNTWNARLTVNGETFNFGSFKSEDAARSAFLDGLVVHLPDVYHLDIDGVIKLRQLTSMVLN